jgi:hypothetical protein
LTCPYLDVVGVELVARQGIERAEVQASRKDTVTSTAAMAEEKTEEYRYINCST